MLKADLRKLYLSQQRLLALPKRLESSQQISDQFFQHFALKEVKIVHIFLSIELNKEVVTELIYEKLWQDFPDIQTVVPRINVETDELESLEFNKQTSLLVNKWQIAEPIGNELIAAQTIDLVIVPLLAFDKKGFRVGYGKGYYDKFLRTCRKDCLKIGLSYFPPVEEISDIHKNDVRLDYCLTPLKIYKF